jgi:hypothetical protein
MRKQIQWLAAKFPAQQNGEFFMEQGILAAGPANSRAKTKSSPDLNSGAHTSIATLSQNLGPRRESRR